MLKGGHAPVTLPSPLVHEGWHRGKMGFDEGEIAADLKDAIYKLEHVGRIQVVEDAQAQHNVELAVLFLAEVAHIVLYKFYVR